MSLSIETGLAKASGGWAQFRKDFSPGKSSDDVPVPRRGTIAPLPRFQVTFLKTQLVENLMLWAVNLSAGMLAEAPHLLSDCGLRNVCLNLRSLPCHPG